MQFIIEAITRQDNLVLVRFRAGKETPVTPWGEVCLWYGEEGVAAVRADDLAEMRRAYAACHPAAEWGYSRILFDGIGLHSLAGEICGLLEEYPVAAVTVSDIRLGILLPTIAADQVWLKIWSRYGAMLSADRQIKAPGQLLL